MKKITLSLHTSLDGFVAGPAGEMDWIKFDDEVFELVGRFTDEADTALYGRITYQMMDNYWPTAADRKGATKHDTDHSNWYNRSRKVVISRTMKDAEINNTTIISNDIPTAIGNLKKDAGKGILIFGSPSIAHILTEHNLIDDYWLFISPVVLGQGIPVFPKLGRKIELQHVDTKTFSCGVTGLHYKQAAK